MADQQFWSVTASAFGGGCLGAVITGLINWRLNRKNYRDDYYKKIIDKRIEAYETLELIIADLKLTTIKNSKSTSKAYNFIFSNRENITAFISNMASITSKTIWFSDEINDNMRKLNQIVNLAYELSDDELEEFAISIYDKIAEIRNCFETKLADEFLNLHEIDKFLNKKKNTTDNLTPFLTALNRKK